MSEDTKALTERLDTLIQLFAVALIDKKKQRDQIRLLSLAGLKPARIAEIIGTSRNTVNVALSNMRRDRELRFVGKPSDEEA